MARMAIFAKTQKRHEEKSERGGELQQTPLLRERIKVNHDAALRSSKVFHPKLLIIVVTL